MRTSRIGVCGLVGLCMLLAVPRSADAAGVQPRVETLDNGLELILVERREQPMVAAGMFYDVGSVNDPRGQSGIAHLFEHMLFKGSRVIGTKDYEAEKVYIAEQERIREQMNVEMDRMRLMKRRGELTDVLDPNQWTPQYKSLQKQFDELVTSEREYIINNELFNLYTTNGGAGLNAGTAEDVTMYYVQLPSNKLELFFWLEADRMVNGIMREFYIERDNVREERRLRTESTPTGRLDEQFDAMFWQAHPYGVPVIGWASEVESITAQDVRDFYKLYYAPNNVKMVLVGDFDADKAIEMAKRYFGKIPAVKDMPRPVITEEIPPLAVRRFEGEAETDPRVRLRYLTVAIGHADEPAFEVISGLLSGKTGRLYKRLVEQEDLCIGVPRAGNQAQKYAGSFDVSATVKEGKSIERVEQVILEELDKLATGEITDREMQKVKNQTLADSVRSLRTNRGLMFQLGVSDVWYDWKHVNELPDRVLKTTTDDVRRVLKQYFDPNTRTVAIYRTKKTAGSADEALAAVLAKVPEDMRGQIKASYERIKQASDAGMLSTRIQATETALSSGQVPEEQKAVFEFMLSAMKKRLAEVESAGKESK